MMVYRPPTEGEALTTIYEKYHIEKTLPGLEAIYLTSRPNCTPPPPRPRTPQSFRTRPSPNSDFGGKCWHQRC